MAFKDLGHLVESRIQGAMARGRLDNLPGSGQPLKEYDLGWLSQEERVEVLVARSAGGVPGEVELLKEIAELRDELARTPDGPARRKLEKVLQDRSLRLNVMFEAAGRNVLATPALDGLVGARPAPDDDAAAGEGDGPSPARRR
jgi:hypothetical protein